APFALRHSLNVERLGIKKRSEEAGIPSICLHSYRYSWAERARAAGYPERYAQEALGHQSTAIHRAYAKRAQVELPPLEHYEKRPAPGAPPPAVIVLPAPEAAGTSAAVVANNPAASPAVAMQEVV
ncbi:MAG: hypothetical protein L0Z50_28990, partial [Verrucomicrobiales bacterium]|nr:hypothetical protein [Verrucomicrobiales bacterium]